MLTLKVAGILGLAGIRNVRWVFLWFGCIINPSRTLFLLAYAGVALPGVGPFLRNFGVRFLLSSTTSGIGKETVEPEEENVMYSLEKELNRIIAKQDEAEISKRLAKQKQQMIAESREIK